MNNIRRKQLEVIKGKIMQLKDILEELNQELDILKEEEQDCYDNIPDNLKAGENGDKIEQAIQEMESALDIFQTIQDEIEEILEALENAQN